MKKKKRWTFPTSTGLWHDVRLSLEAKALWHILAGFANHKTRRCHPSNRSLQVIADLGRRKTATAIAELEKVGAIKKETVPVFKEGRFVGRRCEYIVNKITDWQCLEHYTARYNDLTEHTKTERSVMGLSENGHITISQLGNNNPKKNNKPSSLHLPMEDRAFDISEGEISAFLADRGFGEAACSATCDRISRMGFRNEHRQPFRSPKALLAFAEALAGKIEEARNQ